jgi:hypothetical protein
MIELSKTYVNFAFDWEGTTFTVECSKWNQKGRKPFITVSINGGDSENPAEKFAIKQFKRTEVFQNIERNFMKAYLALHDKLQDE